MTRSLALLLSTWFIALAPVAAAAADLEPETIAAWDRYVTRVERRIDRELAGGGRFLALDFEPHAGRAREALRRGDLVIRRVDAEGPPGGAIHHWRAAILVPGITVERLIAALRDPRQHGYRPADVLQWRLLTREGSRERVFLQIQRREIVTAVFNTEHDVSFTDHGARRASSRSVSTRIAEVTGAGTPRPAEKPVGRDRGFLWRLNSYWRYEAVPGGVLVELESLSLSRSVPPLLGPVARPIITRVARESIERTLTGIRDQLGRPPRGSRSTPESATAAR